MKRIIIDILVMTFIGGLVGGGIKFFQWIGADLTFGILVTMPTVESVLPMVLKMAAIGSIIGLIIGIFEIVADKRKWNLNGGHIRRQTNYNQHYGDASVDIDEFAAMDEYEQEGSNWKQEQYMDASGGWRMPNDDYIDASGAWRKPGDTYQDASGAWRRPEDDYIDESGAWRKPRDQYIDHSGGWRS